ncbi:uncharacterized protein [Littorina saxatilis]|uniref:uncharacterized protein n=1 Tax=Littorina saxatilis TaxID=31220 RepID=UPI0038B52A57
MASQPQPPRFQEKKIAMALIFAIVCITSIPQATADVDKTVDGKNQAVNVSLHMKVNPNSQPQPHKTPKPTLPQTTGKPSISLDLDLNVDDKKKPAESEKSVEPTRLQTLIDKLTQHVKANLAPDVKNKSEEATADAKTLLNKFLDALNTKPLDVDAPLTTNQKIECELKKIQKILKKQVRKLQQLRAQLNPAVTEAAEGSATLATTPIPKTMAKIISAMLDNDSKSTL